MTDNSPLRRLMQPVSAGRYFDASTMTVVTGAVAITAILVFLLARVSAIVGFHTDRPPFIAFLGAIDGLGFICAPLAVISLLGDLLARFNRRRREMLDRQAGVRATVEAANHNEAMLSMRDELRAIYKLHHPAIVERVRALLSPDHYGRLNTTAVAAELTEFQEQVATPQLHTKGYADDLIVSAFLAERVELLRPILHEASSAA